MAFFDGDLFELDLVFVFTTNMNDNETNLPGEFHRLVTSEKGFVIRNWSAERSLNFCSLE